MNLCRVFPPGLVGKPGNPLLDSRNLGPNLGKLPDVFHNLTLLGFHNVRGEGAGGMNEERGVTTGLGLGLGLPIVLSDTKHFEE